MHIWWGLDVSGFMVCIPSRFQMTMVPCCAENYHLNRGYLLSCLGFTKEWELEVEKPIQNTTNIQTHKEILGFWEAAECSRVEWLVVSVPETEIRGVSRVLGGEAVVMAASEGPALFPLHREERTGENGMVRACSHGTTNCQTTGRLWVLHCHHCPDGGHHLLYLFCHTGLCPVSYSVSILLLMVRHIDHWT